MPVHLLVSKFIVLKLTNNRVVGIEFFECTGSFGSRLKKFASNLIYWIGQRLPHLAERAKLETQGSVAITI